ncbi:MAG: type IV pilus secretin PilQ [Candidatus Aminicenantes bacterium]|jgi:type IV pilus assembly protein PilQ
MKRAKTLWMVCWLCLFTAIGGTAQGEGRSLKINQIFVHPGEIFTQVVLQLNSPPPLFPSDFSTEHPSTIVVNLGQAEFDIDQFPSLADDLIIKDIITEVDPGGFSRLLLPLKKKIPFRLSAQKNTFIIELNKFQNTRPSDFVPADINTELKNRQDISGYLKTIDIAETPNGVDFKIKLYKKPIVDIFALEHPYRLVADLYRVKDALEPTLFKINRDRVKHLRVSQFHVSDHCAITRLVFDLEEPRPYSLSSVNNQLVISFPSQPNGQEVNVEPALSSETDKNETNAKDTTEVPQPEEQKEAESLSGHPSLGRDDRDNGSTSPASPQIIGYTEQKYSGERVDLRFKDADLRDVVLYLGSEVAGLNVVFDPNVRGTITCNLVAIPWDQALDVLLKNNRMGWTIEGNVLRVAPIDVLAREKEDKKRVQESKEFTEPILIRTYPLSYASAEEVQLLIENKLSERGEIIVDKRTNTLIISDIEDRINVVEQLITAFDKATPQVTIEARIVEATSTFVRNLGIQWGWRGISDPFFGNQTSLQFPNKILVDGGLIPEGLVTKGIGGPLGGYAINLPAPSFSTAVGLSLSNVLDTFGLDMALTALETSGNGKVISRPTVTTQNNVEAEIIQGSQIPVQTMANFTTTTTFVNAALELRARPQITEDGTIIMYLEIRNNSPDFGNLVNGIPPITMQSATTTVMIPDGGTTVIGGIYQTENSITRDRVPFLHKVPLLGLLFRSSSRTKKSRELLIFITPRINKK